MSVGSKPSILLLIISVIISGGTFYSIGRGPIAGLQEEISLIGTENLAFQSQVEQLTDSNNVLLDRLEEITENLSATQFAFQTLQASFDELSGLLTSTQSDLQNLVSSYEESQTNNSYLLGLYSSVWEKYADLITVYNNLTSVEPVGEMTFTRISGVVNGEFNEGGGWVKQGKGGQGPPYASLWQYPSSTYLTQSVTFSSKDQGIVFKHKPSPFGAEVTFSFSIDGITVFSGTYSGVNENFDWEEVVIPFKPICEMKELYGFDGDGTYEIRFSVEAGEDNGARVAIDDVSLIVIEYKPEEPAPPTDHIEYIKNGEFEEPTQHDPWKIPEWDGGGTIGVSQGYIGKAVYLYQWSYRHGSDIFQSVNIESTSATLSFWIKPYPQGQQVSFQCSFDGTILLNETYTGSNVDYEWEEIQIQLYPEIGMHEIRFSVLAGPEYYPGDMSYVVIDEVSLTS